MRSLVQNVIDSSSKMVDVCTCIVVYVSMRIVGTVVKIGPSITKRTKTIIPVPIKRTNFIQKNLSKE